MYATQISKAGQSDWRQSLARAVRDPGVLCQRLRLSAQSANEVKAACRDFPLLVPESYLERMRPGDPSDPLLLQVLPDRRELLEQPGFSVDAVGDRAARRAPGLLHKYHARALLLVSRSCAVHCRYCFRRHYPYDEEPGSWDDFGEALAALADDASIREVILSGGDPLVRTDRWLARLTEAVANIPSISVLRVHTRLPIVLPDRVTEDLLHWLSASRLQTIVVLHANHANELVGDCAAAIGRLRSAGVLLLNQSVLLRGVNDSVNALENLSCRLVSLGVVPYYLHQLDRVRGASHFEVSQVEGIQLIARLRDRLPGYLVPRYVRESPGMPRKEEIV